MCGKGINIDTIGLCFTLFNFIYIYTNEIDKQFELYIFTDLSVVYLITHC